VLPGQQHLRVPDEVLGYGVRRIIDDTEASQNPDSIGLGTARYFKVDIDARRGDEFQKQCVSSRVTFPEQRIDLAAHDMDVFALNEERRSLLAVRVGRYLEGVIAVFPLGLLAERGSSPRRAR